jgi:hypothetical protein
VIVALRPGFYNIEESANSPIVLIGKSLRSAYGIVIGEEDDEEIIDEETIDEEIIDEETIDEEIIDEETIDEEEIDEEEIDEEDIWIPYQEFRAPADRLATTTTTPNASRRSRWQAYISIPLETHAFIHPTPKEVLYYMLESIEEFHSNIYGSFLYWSRDSGLDFLSLLLLEALRILSSGNYSRDK